MKQFNFFSNKFVRISSLVILFSLLLSACGYAAAAPQAAPASIPVTGASVQVADQARFGKILVNASGLTLYTFEIDSPTESKCTDSGCVTYWPPLTVNGLPAAGSGVSGKLATITRPDGSQQLTYNGKPLYTFKLDQKPGDATGDGINQYGGVWHVVSLSGSPSSGNNTPSGSYGY